MVSFREVKGHPRFPGDLPLPLPRWFARWLGAEKDAWRGLWLRGLKCSLLHERFPGRFAEHTGFSQRELPAGEKFESFGSSSDSQFRV